MNAGRAKVEAEGVCRVCGAGLSTLEAAHTFDRSLGKSSFDDPDLIVPLCGRFGNHCHQQYDANRLNLLPYLSLAEQVALVRVAGGIERARKRVIGK
jgi:hypothetical protein